MAEPVNSSLHERLAEDLTCGVCLEEYKDPRALPCLHVYCRTCLDVLISQSADPKTVTCPVCRQQAKIPGSSSAVGFPSDFRIQNLLELSRELDKHTKTQLQVTSTCRCNSCQGAHVSRFCDTCGPLCAECALKEAKKEKGANHKIHVCGQSSERQGETPLLFNSEYMYEVKRTKAEFEVDLKAIDEVRDHISAQEKATKDSIRTAFQELGAILQRRQEVLLKQVGDLTAEKLASIDEQKKKLKSAHDYVSNYAMFLDQTIEKKQTGELSTFQKVTSTYWNRKSEEYKSLQRTPCEQANLQFYCDENVAQRFRDVGSVIVTSVSPAHCTADGRGTSRATIGQLADCTVVLVAADGSPCNDPIQDVKAFLKQLSGDANACVPCRVVGKDGNKIVLSYCPLEMGEHLLHIQVLGKEIAGSPYRVNVQQPFTFRGDFVREFGGLERPWGIACAPSGHIVAVDNTGWKGVHVFDSSGGVLCSFMEAMRSVNVWGPEGMCYYPTGVTVDKEGNILVVDGGMNRIQKFTESGTLLKVAGSAGNGSLQFNSPTGIRVNTAGEVYVCDRKNHRIQVLDADLSFLRAFGRCGPSDGEFVFPRDVAFDSSQNVYVADVNNHRIQVFSPDGVFLRKFGSLGEGRDQFKYISSVCVDRKDHVYVADNGKHCVTVFTTYGDVLKVMGGAQGSAPGVLNEPLGVDVGDGGLLYVADAGNKRIQVFQ